MGHVAFFGVLGLAYHAGKEAGGLALTDIGSLPGSASGPLLAAIGLALAGALSVVFVLSRRVLKPLSNLANFSERLVAGDARARAEVGGDDEFALIAENLQSQRR